MVHSTGKWSGTGTKEVGRALRVAADSPFEWFWVKGRTIRDEILNCVISREALYDIDAETVQVRSYVSQGEAVTAQYGEDLEEVVSQF